MLDFKEIKTVRKLTDNFSYNATHTHTHIIYLANCQLETILNLFLKIEKETCRERESIGSLPKCPHQPPPGETL